jgi:hypothetical protein
MLMKKKSLQQFLPVSETEIQGLLHPAKVNLGYCLVRFQSLQLPSTQSESPLAIESHASLKARIQLSTEFFDFHISIRITHHPD